MSSSEFQVPTEQEINQLSVPELKQIASQLDIPYRRNTRGTTLRSKINTKRNASTKVKTNSSNHTEVGCKRTREPNDDANIEECNPKKKPKLDDNKSNEREKSLQSEIENAKQTNPDASNSESDDNETANNVILIDFYRTHKFQRCCRHPIRCSVLQDNDTYEFIREPENYYDDNAIAIYGTDTDDKVGYIPRDIAYTLAPSLGAGKIRLEHSAQSYVLLMKMYIKFNPHSVEEFMRYAGLESKDDQLTITLFLLSLQGDTKRSSNS
eukprot:163089_1